MEMQMYFLDSFKIKLDLKKNCVWTIRFCILIAGQLDLIILILKIIRYIFGNKIQDSLILKSNSANILTFGKKENDEFSVLSKYHTTE